MSVIRKMVLTSLPLGPGVSGKPSSGEPMAALRLPLPPITHVFPALALPWLARISGAAGSCANGAAPAAPAPRMRAATAAHMTRPINDREHITPSFQSSARQGFIDDGVTDWIVMYWSALSSS